MNISTSMIKLINHSRIRKIGFKKRKEDIIEIISSSWKRIEIQEDSTSVLHNIE
jgi:hypothetical protein